MELRDLNYFAVIARRGSLAGASDELGLSPAALSKSLRRLETAIEAKLVERAAHGVALTSAGSLLLSRVQKLRLTVDDVKREAVEIATGRAGRLRVGSSQVDWEQTAMACTTLLAGEPELAFEVVISTNDLMVPQLRKGELDLIVSLLPAMPFEGTGQETLFEAEMFVIASTNHPLAGRRHVALAEAAQERWVISPADVLSRYSVERVLRDAGLPPVRIAIESRSIQLRLFALAHARLLGLGSTRLLSQAARSGFKLVRIPVKELVWPIRVGVIYRKGGYLPRSGRRFIEALRSNPPPAAR